MNRESILLTILADNDIEGVELSKEARLLLDEWVMGKKSIEEVIVESKARYLKEEENV